MVRMMAMTWSVKSWAFLRKSAPSDSKCGRVVKSDAAAASSLDECSTHVVCPRSNTASTSDKFRTRLAAVTWLLKRAYGPKIVSREPLRLVRFTASSKKSVYSITDQSQALRRRLQGVSAIPHAQCAPTVAIPLCKICAKPATETPGTLHQPDTMAPNPKRFQGVSKAHQQTTKVHPL